MSGLKTVSETALTLTLILEQHAIHFFYTQLTNLETCANINIIQICYTSLG
jgi:hypothetical protein